MKEQRLSEIIKLLNDKGYSTVQELAKQLDVSPSTVRRDLQVLTMRNLVAFRKDGIVPLSSQWVDTPISHRVSVNVMAKHIIAMDALKLVEEGSSIFLDSSTTVLAMVDALRSFKNLIVITNSLPVASKLKSSGVRINLIGGEMSPRSGGFYGPLAEEAVKEFNFDMAFMSPVAITPENYVAETIEPAATIRRAAMEQARCSVLLCDHSKIGQSRPYNIAHLDNFDYIITDDNRYIFETTATVRRVK
jgi:DeoR/GlpR family transcriptional regulator of sugar metabolism